MKKLLGILVLGLLWCNVVYADHCGLDFDRSWNWNDDKTWMEWSFKNKTDKAITILSTGLKTRDKKLCMKIN